MTTDSIDALPLADTTDMAEVHRLFRTALARGPKLVTDVADGDVERAGHVAPYFINVLRFLHSHHAAEDELLTPRLIERNPDQAELIASVAEMHRPIQTTLELALTQLATWPQAPGAAASAELASTLGRLDTELTTHLDREEAEVVPIAARCINVAEWGELPGHVFMHFDGDRLWLIIGLVREVLSPEHRANMEAHMPPPVTEMWVNSGERLFTEYMAELLR